MAKDSAVTNEEIIAALLGSGTIKQAAETAGLSSRAIYDRMGDKDFRAEYAAARAAIVRASVANINSRVAAAIDTIANVMQDPETNPAVRLQAAQAILTNAVKFAERLTAEDTSAADARRDPFDIFDNVR